ncbi:FAD-dependent monooxygenase [Xenorhabdus kozodoii]|uniref:Ferredoxin--NADP reductase n=1 Tax=Xenorhabdus kozodoii TaxID=351676 RepID=A0A2D0LAI7_9GAMM|nr:FAD-dependent monooxygenase [Xenorhabdus kozodoii]PHM72691.1 Ferredoxin--NADP reductase [Xenorhabdus kozodoii]
MVEYYDVAIIGSGPAGLAAAQCLNGSGLRSILIDQGRAINERDKDTEAELTQGHGGAGLYSDGKFSFFPSASHLWNLPQQEALHAAYDWTCNLLTSYGLSTPPFPDNPEAYTVGSGEWVLKEYPSDYLSLQARLELIAQLINSTESDILTDTRVSHYRYLPECDYFEFILIDDKNQLKTLHVKRIIVASGRFGPLEIPDMLRHSFRRLEVGFRIEQPHDLSFFGNMPQLDPKLKFQSESGEVEWRTFCACRGGETVLTQTLGLWTVSGHSDGPYSGRSNVGFNTRVLDEKIAKDSLPAMLNELSKPESYFRVKLQDVLNTDSESAIKLKNTYGEKLMKLMLDGVKSLMKKFPILDHPETRLIGPTLEGIGWYPEINGELRMPDLPVWVAGDACGLFRGIVAAFISGHYVASSVLSDLQRS